MNKTSRGLGKGLGALLKTDKSVAPAAKPEGQVQEIPVTKITANKQQPRTVFTAEALEELAGSIAQFGVLQPLLLKKTADGYEIVAGERRFRAAKAAGLKTVPAIVRNLSAAETTEIALIENLQREDLNIIEEATAYARLMNEFDLTQEQVSERIGKSRPHIANCLRLLNLPAKVQTALAEGILTMGQARPLLAITEIDKQLAAAECIINDRLSARQAEELVKSLLAQKKVLYKAPKAEPDQEVKLYYSAAMDRLKMFFGAPVRITTGKKKNKIEIEYTTQEDLERILALVSGGNGLAAKARTVDEKKELLRKFSQQGFNV